MKVARVNKKHNITQIFRSFDNIRHKIKPNYNKWGTWK